MFSIINLIAKLLRRKKSLEFLICKCNRIILLFSYNGGLSQWGRSNRPRIRPGTVKSPNAPWELSQLSLRRDYAKKIDPCRMLVWLGRRTVQNMVKNRASIGLGQYTLLSGRPVQTGRSCSNSNLLQPRVIFVRKVKTRGATRSRTRTSDVAGILTSPVFRLRYPYYPFS